MKFYATNRTNNELLVIPSGTTVTVGVRDEFTTSFGLVPDALSGVYVQAVVGRVLVTGAWPNSPAFSRELRQGDVLDLGWINDPLTIPAHPVPCDINITDVTEPAGGSSTSSAPGVDAEVAISLRGVDY